MEKEREQSRFLIQRFDNYISGANTKGNFLLAFNTFLCGALIANYDKLSLLIINKCCLFYLNITLCLIIIVGLIAIAFIIKAVYPFQKSGNSSVEKYHSKIFFNSITEFGSDKEFAKVYHNQEDEEVDEDLARQAYILSKGLKSKYYNLNWAMRLIYVELILLLILLIIIIIC